MNLLDKPNKIFELYRNNGGIIIYEYDLLTYEDLIFKVTDNNRDYIIKNCNRIKYTSKWWWHPFNPFSYNSEFKIQVNNGRFGWVFITKKSSFIRFINLAFMYLLINYIDYFSKCIERL